MKIKAIIPAGGSSSRYKGKNKLLEILNDKPVILHSIDTISSIESVEEIIIPASLDLMPVLKEILKDYSNVKIVQGGKNRQESVYNGLKNCGECDFVIIHDGARPLIKKETILKCLESAYKNKAVIVAVKTIDTIKIVDENLKIIETPNRENLWNVQTPQIFDYNLILSAHQKLAGENFSDDAGLLESLNVNVFVVEGEYSNFKITTENDLIQAKIKLS